MFSPPKSSCGAQRGPNHCRRRNQIADDWLIPRCSCSAVRRGRDRALPQLASELRLGNPQACRGAADAPGMDDFRVQPQQNQIHRRRRAAIVPESERGRRCRPEHVPPLDESALLVADTSFSWHPNVPLRTSPLFNTDTTPRRHHVDPRRWPPGSRAYGTRMELILDVADSIAARGERFGPDLTRAEVNDLCEHEWALTDPDILWRRIQLGLRTGAADVAGLTRFVQQLTGRGQGDTHEQIRRGDRSGNHQHPLHRL